MFALLAAALGIAGYLIDGSGSNTSPWVAPGPLALAVLALIALHLSGGSWTRKP